MASTSSALDTVEARRDRMLAVGSQAELGIKSPQDLLMVGDPLIVLHKASGVLINVDAMAPSL